MANIRFSSEQLREEPCRVITYGDNSNIPAKDDLAKGGFYFMQIGHKIKCADCGLEVDTSSFRMPEEVFDFHKNRSPSCPFSGSQSVPLNRTKKFISYDSLRFEKERLETFIDWPIDWLSPAELAKDGFYYLRTADHCACVFCRGIVGAWERGDTPRVEHKRHFPHCPFIKGDPVGNIPLAHSTIISRISPTPDAAPTLPLSMDVCGSGRPRPGSYPESKPPKTDDFSKIGLPRHSGPKREDYLNQADREKSFGNWPERVKQTPKELAEAGFFYCGLSDHVRCFHCGNGLRNWEKDDEPWVEHARWYPECNFILLKKGLAFVDKVRREKPPYIPTQPATKVVTAARPQITITEQELDALMQLDIIRATIAMDFPADKVRATLRRKLEQTGQPFFRLDTCIEALLQYMEEESRLASKRSVEAEAAAQQEAKMEVVQSTSDRQPAVMVMNSSVTTTTAAAAAPTTSVPSSSSFSSSLPSAGPSSHPDPQASPEEPMETSSSPVSPTEEILSQADQVIGLAEQALNAAPTSSSSPTPNPSSGPSLVTSVTSTPTTPPSGPSVVPSSSSIAPSAVPAPNYPEAVKKVAEKQLPSGNKLLKLGKVQTSQELAAELEKIRDLKMCKVCMDAEIDLVFLPCTHMVTCSSCAIALTKCPICRESIVHAIKPILS